MFKFFEKGRNLLLAWVVYLGFGIFLFQFSAYPHLKEINGNAEIPEERFGFSVGYFYGFLENLQEVGRSVYFNFQLLDYVNALLLGIVLFGTLYYFLNRLTENKFVRVILSFPIFAAGFDILENSSILYLLSSFPERAETFAGFVSFLTKMKMTAGVLSGLAVLICGVGVLLKFIVEKIKR